MIRYKFIDNQVLGLYNALPSLSFPLDVYGVIDCIPSCKYLSYQQFASLNGCSPETIAESCGSKFGCTNYDTTTGRYLILCNRSTDGNNTLGRQRWTCGHEIGHVVCKHNLMSSGEFLTYSNDVLGGNVENECEREADYFAATLLAPFPLFDILNVKSVTDVQNIFGLSCEASINRYKQYLKWKNTHYKTGWSNDMVKTYVQKQAK